MSDVSVRPSFPSTDASKIRRVAGLALVPLILAREEAGNEIQAPMGVVILGGLLSATVLNMLVLPLLFKRFGRAPQPQAGAAP